MTFTEIRTPNIYSRENLAWAAGLFEGEGCFTLTYGKNLQATLKMTDKDVVERFQSVIGFGTIKRQEGERVGYKPQYKWCVGSFEKVQALAAMLWPWLHTRRRTKIVEVITMALAYDVDKRDRTRNRKALIEAALLEMKNLPTWGRRWLNCKTNKDIAIDHGVSVSLVSHIKKEMAGY